MRDARSIETPVGWSEPESSLTVLSRVFKIYFCELPVGRELSASHMKRDDMRRRSPSGKAIFTHSTCARNEEFTRSVFNEAVIDMLSDLVACSLYDLIIRAHILMSHSPYTLQMRPKPEAHPSRIP